MIECKTTVDEHVQGDILRVQKILCIVMLVVGIVGIIAYIVLQTIFDNSLLNILLLFAVFFGFGLVFTISTTNTIKKAGENPFTNTYSFDVDTLSIECKRGEEIVATITTKYSEFYKVKETDRYLLLYPSKLAVYPVLKSNLSENDLIEIRRLLKITEPNKT